MTVRELIDQLSLCDGERIVVMSQDGEGNNFSPLVDLTPGAYAADSPYSGEFGIEVLNAVLLEQGFDEDDIISGVPAICMWPTN